MSIPKEHLTKTFGNAPAILVYGAPGTRKTNMIATLPAPVMLFSIERGNYSVLPWVRRSKNWDGPWVDFSPEQRQENLNLLNKEIFQTLVTDDFPVSAPLIDIIQYDVLEPRSYTQLAQDFLNLDFSQYKSVAIDSLQDLSFQTQVFSKSKGGVESAAFIATTPMHVKWWAETQSRLVLILRKIKEAVSSGVVVYMISGEAVDKEYVTDPRDSNAPQIPYLTRGTVNLPGKIPSELGHFGDLILRATLINGKIQLVAKPQQIPGSTAHWEAKDRFGRLPTFCPPNIKKIFNFLVGPETTNQIYNS